MSTDHRQRFVTLGLLTIALAAILNDDAHGFTTLTTAKVARFTYQGDPADSGGIIKVGPDPELQVIRDPTCPATSSIALDAYLQSTLRIERAADVVLDCAKWMPTRRGFRYLDPTGTVRSIRYDPGGLRIKIRGGVYAPIPGPVAFLQADFRIAGELLRVRFHDFRQNDLPAIVSRKPSTPAAQGEAGFWAVLTGDDTSEARQLETIAHLETAQRRRPGHGRPHFLRAMIHLYRFGQRVTTFASVSSEAHAELVAANLAFASAVPLLWNDAAGTGDSRVPGFAASAKYLLGLVDNDAALRAEGLADLERAIEVNAFFNVFDYIPVLQSLPPADPLFQEAFAIVAAYLADPESQACFFNQPMLCANEGFAAHNTQGSLTLFGDLYAKAGNLSEAQYWYNLANAFPETATWPFVSVIQDRVANAPARVALYTDGDPANDPPIIGAGAEACASCHNR